MVNTNKIIEVCYKQNLQGLPALKQLIQFEQLNAKEDVERIGNNIVEYLKENNLWRTSSNPPNRVSSNPPTRISSVPPERKSMPPSYK